MSTLNVTKGGTKIWRNKDGKLHREDGPAIVYFDGYKEYWINGRILTKERWFEQLPAEQKVKVSFKLDEL